MDLNERIKGQLSEFPLLLYMKGTPDFPQCGFSANIVGILDYFGIEYQSYNVLEDNELREGIKTFSDWPTIPQIYIKKEFIGGCDIIKEMFENGELKKVFDEKGIGYKK